MLDPTGRLHSRFGAQRGACYLVRPDGHVAARSFGRDLTPLTAYADTVLQQDRGRISTSRRR